MTGPTSPRPVLAPREAEVKELIDLGLSNREIAKQMGITIHTVKAHVRSLYSRLGIRGVRRPHGGAARPRP